MTKNLNDFENYIGHLDHNFTIIGFSETWLQEFNCNLYGLNGYTIVERHRSTPGGGVAVCISDDVNFMERQDLELFDENMESVFVEINKSQVQSFKDIIVGVIYRPPNKDIDNFNNHMQLLLDKLQKENKSCYILGDMNINIINQETHTKTGQFVDIMFSNSFLPVITRPTRVTATSATLIDHIFTNDVDNLSHCVQGILVTDISFHYPVFHISRMSMVKETEMYMVKRVYNSRNKQGFLEAMTQVDWSEIYTAAGTQSAFDHFHKVLLMLLDKYFPKVKIKKKYNKRKPWLSEALRNSIRHKNKLYTRYKKVKSVHNEVTYRSYKSKLQQLLKAAQKQHYHDLMIKYKDNMKKSWGVIKSIIYNHKTTPPQSKFKSSNGEIITDKNVISQQFNDFFINIGPNLAKNIPNVKAGPKNYLGQALKETLFLDPVTCDETRSLLVSLKNTATGYDEIYSMLLKLSTEFIVNPLTHICNMSLSEGFFPDRMKIANVKPLYKADDPMCFNHYRPLSLLCVLSKVFEKMM